KAEVLEKGPNTRFVVTTRPDEPLAVYDRYVGRGEPENWIKDLKNALRADRLSDHRFWANAFRLLLHAAAYWLLDQLRRWLLQAQVAPSSSTPSASASSRSAAGYANAPTSPSPTFAFTLALTTPAKPSGSSSH